MKTTLLETLVILLVLSPFYLLYNSEAVVDQMRETTVFVGCDGGSGSGVVVNTNGLIVTNRHVTDGCENMYVVHQGERYDATLKMMHFIQDLAIIQVDKKFLVAADLNTNPKKGEKVYTVGSPMGFIDVVSVGVVGTSMYFGFQEYILHDADIYPGNSGGGLYDKYGNLLGINSRGYVTPTGTIAMAIPSEDVETFLEGYYEYKEMQQ